jgi:dysferlin
MGPTMTRPKWSDAAGKIKLKKEDFEPPPSWRWDTDWFVSPELSMLFDKDAGHRTFMEDAFECQGRIPGGEWGPSGIAWTDVVSKYVRYQGCVVQNSVSTILVLNLSWC